MKRHSILLILLAALFLIGQSFAGGEVPTGAYLHLNVAQMGMGGMTTVVGNTAHSTFYNPALLNRQDFSLEIIPGSQLGFGNDFLDVIKFINDNQDTFANMDSIANAAAAGNTEAQETINKFYEDSESFDNKWMGVYVSPFIGFAMNGWGAGVYGNLNADVKLDNGVFVPAIGARGYMDVVFGIGHGCTIDIAGKEWELGAALRIVSRRKVDPMRVSASDAANASDLGTTVNDEMQESKTGFGIDLGMVRTISIKDKPVDVGVVIQDLVGVLDGWVKPNLKAGAMYHVPVENVTAVNGFDFGLEIVDILNRQGVSLFQKINIGTEVKVLAGFLGLRAGLHQGYPTYGAGISLGVFWLDYAYFTRELGDAPGMYPESTHRVQISFGWK